LSAAERAEAVHLSQILKQTAQKLRAGNSNIAGLEQSAKAALAERGWQPDYVAIRRSADLQPPRGDEVIDLIQTQGLVILGAARLGQTRLIDNLEV
jgi:pantoate--beta-alanine ligase